jgi:glucokinase
MGHRAVIGIDIGGTKTLCALFNENYKVLEEIRFKTMPAKGERRFTAELQKAVRALRGVAKQKRLTIVGTGVGCAGVVHQKSLTLKVSPNIPFLTDYPLGERLAKLTETDVTLGNDVQVGLYGEQQLGAAKGCRHVIGIFLGTGIGGAVIIDGKLHVGASGVAGQIGHFLTQPMGPLAGSERHGILDNIASKAAITGEALALASKQWAPSLYEEVGTDLSSVGAKALAKAIKKGDKAIAELIGSRMQIVGIVLSNLVNFLSPDLVILGGGLTEAMPKLILKRVEEGMRKFLTPEVDKTVKVAVAELGNHAVTTGAAKQAFDKFFSSTKSQKE